MLGLALFGLGFWQVMYGYTLEWPTFVGSVVPASVNKAWKALVIVRCIYVPYFLYKFTNPFLDFPNLICSRLDLFAQTNITRICNETQKSGQRIHRLR